MPLEKRKAHHTFNHIAILVPVLAKSFHANANNEIKKT
jgi:hypothetical protein